MSSTKNPPVLNESLGAILGEEDAQRVLELMDKFGDECEAFVRLFLSELIQAKEEMVDAQEKIDDLLRKLYGPTRERFVDPNPMELFEDLAPGMPPVQEEEKESKVAYSRKKPRRLFGGRNQNLPTKTIGMDPEGELSHLKKIGEEVHRVFHDQPARIFVYEYVRNKYVDPTNQGAGVLMGELPANVRGKRTVSAEMLAQIVIHTYVDHLPVDRTRKPFFRLGADLPNSTLNDVCTHVATDLAPLYDLLRVEVLQSGYIQADETRIPVRDQTKSNASGKHHLG